MGSADQVDRELAALKAQVGNAHRRPRSRRRQGHPRRLRGAPEDRTPGAAGPATPQATAGAESAGAPGALGSPACSPGAPAEGPSPAPPP